jgi:hypothetical protein
MVLPDGSRLLSRLPAPGAPRAIRGEALRIPHLLRTRQGLCGRFDLRRRRPQLRVCAPDDARWSSTLRFVCKLPQGTHRFSVYAKDIAGKVQMNVAKNQLVVK